MKRMIAVLFSMLCTPALAWVDSGVWISAPFDFRDVTNDGYLDLLVSCRDGWTELGVCTDDRHVVVLVGAPTGEPIPNEVFCSEPRLFYFEHNVDPELGEVFPPGGYWIELQGINHYYPLDSPWLSCGAGGGGDECVISDPTLQVPPGFLYSWRVKAAIGPWSTYQQFVCSTVQ